MTGGSADETTISATSGEETESSDAAPIDRDRATLPAAAKVVDRVRSRARYEILSEHGRGALGRVSRALDRDLGREVAIKELLSRGNDEEIRFLREVQITARLEHPGIVPVHEAGRWADGTPFYAMKLVAGRPLRDLLAEAKAVDERLSLLHHLIAVADAIAYAHRRNVIHRDLKPANIIVGEFGETVVIDWGLAKDLSNADDREAATGPSSPQGKGDLTVTAAGAIVGTPAYMAPEQSRGEPVDARADVFAIGVMLWELCTSRRAVAPEGRARHRLLRRAGIDRDLASILDKSLAPDPAQRYRDAGELAADLKAFKSGARIAARHYTLIALLTHWTRRHRSIAIASIALLVTALTVGLAYVRNIAAARDSADRARGEARHAQLAAEGALEELTLRHAQTLLTTDPTAVLAALASYHGADRDRAEQIRAEAIGRGVALIHASPHTNNVAWAAGTADGAVLSLSLDGTIVKTSRDGQSTVVARDAARSSAWDYAAARHLLAYACNPSDVCLFDTLHIANISRFSSQPNVKVASLAVSPDGTLLAVLSLDAEVILLDVRDPAHPAVRATRHATEGTDIKFVDDATIAILAASTATIIPLDGEPWTVSVPDSTTWDTRSDAHSLAIGTAAGQAVLIDVRQPGHSAARADLCNGEISSLRFVRANRGLAYACRSGTVGLWSRERVVTPQAQLEGRADMLTTDPAGDYLFVAGSNGTVVAIDLTTRLVSSFKGHGFRLTALTAPTPEYPFVISGDVRGSVRVWRPPQRLVRLITTGRMRYHTMIIDEPTGAVIAAAWRPALTVIEPSGASRDVQPHGLGSVFLAQASDSRTFAAYGLNDRVELWSSSSMTLKRVIDTGHGSLSQLRFLDHGEDFITSGHDGRLVRWTSGGQQIELTRADQPIDRFALIDSGAVVFSTLDGALWRTEGQHVRRLHDPGARVYRILATPNPARVYIGYANGDVMELDLASWQSEIVRRGAGAIYEMSASQDGSTVAIATTEGALHIGTRGPATQGSSRSTWVTFAARARGIAVTPDGLVVATYSDGTIWLYAPSQRRWLCVTSGTADLARVVIDASGRTALTVDMEGRMLGVDLAAARAELRRNPATEL